jgi:hypothetical protein
LLSADLIAGRWTLPGAADLLADPDAIDRLVSGVLGEFGRIDTLLNVCTG